MAQFDMTSLASVKSYLSIPPAPNAEADPLLSQMITRVSSVILAYLSRSSLLRHEFVEVRDGQGGPRLILRHWPVLSVAEVSVIGAGGMQYIFDPWDGLPPGKMQSLQLVSNSFPRGRGNVTIKYVAGYVQVDEIHVIPNIAPYEVAVEQPHGLLARDEGVTFYDTGAALIKIANPAPDMPLPTLNANTYTPAEPLRTPAVSHYHFAEADAGKSIKISYSYIPWTLENAACEWVGERYKYRERIGQTSKQIGGQETVSYQITDMNPMTRLSLNPFRNVVPIL